MVIEVIYITAKFSPNDGYFFCDPYQHLLEKVFVFILFIDVFLLQ